MAYVLSSPFLGDQSATSVDTIGPGPTGSTGIGPTGLVGGFDSVYVQERQGNDINLGGGTFQYLRFSGTIAANTICEITPTLTSGQVISSATAWAGTVITGRPLCVAMVAGTVGQWGWFQVQGNAIVTTSGAPAAGNPAYWQAAGVVSPTPVAGKQIVNAEFATAVSVTIGTGTGAVVLSATQSVLLINRPFAQGAIT